MARDGNGKYPRFGVIGFDPLQANLKFQVTTPILFANFMRWLSPDSFSTLDLSAGSVGTATVTLDPNERTDQMRVVNEQGLALPFTCMTVRCNSLRQSRAYCMCIRRIENAWCR